MTRRRQLELALLSLAGSCIAQQFGQQQFGQQQFGQQQQRQQPGAWDSHAMNPWNEARTWQNPWTTGEAPGHFDNNAAGAQNDIPNTIAPTSAPAQADGGGGQVCRDACQVTNRAEYQCNSLTLIKEFNICRCRQYHAQM